MQLLEELENCQSLDCIKDKLYVKTPEGNILDGRKIAPFDVSIHFSYHNNDIYYYAEGKLINFSQNETLIKGSSYKAIRILQPGFYFLHNRTKSDELVYEVKDENNNTLWDNIGNQFIDIIKVPFLMKTERFDFQNFSIIHAHTGNPLWQFSAPAGFQIMGTPIVVGEVLVVEVRKNVNDAYQKIGMDIKTGQELWRNSYQMPFEKHNIAKVLRADNQLLYGYKHLLQEFDPIEGEMLRERDMSEYYESGIRPTNVNHIYGNRMFWSSGRGEKCKFGSVNLDTFEMEFIQDFPLENDSMVDSIVFLDGRLYIKDQGDYRGYPGTLHVFEE